MAVAAATRGIPILTAWQTVTARAAVARVEWFSFRALRLASAQSAEEMGRR
jgi:hypothetical protein